MFVDVYFTLKLIFAPTKKFSVTLSTFKIS